MKHLNKSIGGFIFSFKEKKKFSQQIFNQDKSMRET